MEVCGVKPVMCEHTFQLVYLFVEAYLKPVADACETATFLASCLCFHYLAQESSSSSTLNQLVYLLRLILNQ